jgi:CheY-like chemotaxis protein
MSTVTGAAILVVRDDPGELRQLLERRVGLDYLVEAVRSVPAALKRLRTWAGGGTRVALLLADPRVGQPPTRPLLAAARSLTSDSGTPWIQSA